MPAAVDLALELTESIAAYMTVKFHQKVRGLDSPVPIPSDWDTHILYECHLALDILHQAYNNRKVTSWRAEDYVAELTERSTVTDIEGNILLWYLPRALTAERTVQMWDDMNLLDKSLRISKGSTSWRIKPTFFRAHPGWLKPGNASMSPAWFQQAHEKSNKLEVSVELAKNHSLAWLRKQVRGSALVAVF
ncbi:hypothetical protein BDZ97DRAFT_1926877 [Flammula alnicola]|nr:hypothetical protein BDZ97DRAFT_1926877 [Flammula alnicola]